MSKYTIRPGTAERVLREDDFIVSKTDPKGRITYCNQIFIEFAGYSEAELLSSPHNIIRHPDMPRGAFKYLRDCLQAGRECFAYVKNLSRDGSCYWVLANVTPSYDENGRREGYFSVRRKPTAAAVGCFSELYRRMSAGEARAYLALDMGQASEQARAVGVDLLDRMVRERHPEVAG